MLVNRWGDVAMRSIQARRTLSMPELASQSQILENLLFAMMVIDYGNCVQ